GLRREAHVPDLVEKQRAAVRQLEFPRAIRERAGEASLHVPEQLALDQLGRDRGAVYFHERPAGAGGERVKGAGHELLPRAVLSGDEHASGRGRDLLDALDHLLHRPARADDLILRVHLGLEPYVLAGEVNVLQGVAQREQDAVGVEGLFQEIVRAELGGLDRGLDRSMTRNHHDLRVRVELAQLPQRLEPVHPLHLHVQENEMGPELGVALQRLGSRSARPHLDLLVFEHLRQRLADALFVIDDQDASAHGWLRLRRYSTTAVGWIRTSANPGETRNGTAPVESAPATRCASCRTTGGGNGMPRRLSSWTVKRASPGRSIRRGPAMRSGSLGLKNPTRGPSASGGITRVSSRQCTASDPSDSSTRNESKLLRTDQSIELPMRDATSLADWTTESGPVARLSRSTLVC